MWSPVVDMIVPGNPTPLTVARVSGTSRAITVLISNVGPAPVIVGVPPSIALGREAVRRLDHYFRGSGRPQ